MDFSSLFNNTHLSLSRKVERSQSQEDLEVLPPMDLEAELPNSAPEEMWAPVKDYPVPEPWCGTVGDISRSPSPIHSSQISTEELEDEQPSGGLKASQFIAPEMLPPQIPDVPQIVGPSTRHSYFCDICSKRHGYGVHA